MKKNKTHMITVRIDDLEHEFIKNDIKRWEEQTGLRIKASDVIRLALHAYEKDLKQKGHITETKLRINIK
ncbi:hypothetical protein [Arsenophonus nasoniae]|uniref:Uncharacterized protein n=1 Tax=Arsenophonus nasoniae TaxID=638 RepID=A0AA95GVS6_9GAMM|nr:hypothetical protein [Arsenophonus nasoniae]WGM04081.1 hypothetical protein QE210_21730 [Arsenophonus nasoniae]